MKPSILIFLLFLTQSAYCGQDIKIDNPSDLINIFYKYLLSNDGVTDCPKIFDEPEVVAYGIREFNLIKSKKEYSDTALIWQYLRENKKIFFFNPEYLQMKLQEGLNQIIYLEGGRMKNLALKTSV